MAARKKAADQASLFIVPPAPSREAARVEYVAPREASAVALTVVPQPVESEVIVETLSDGRFVVSLLRDHGTTVAAVRYTRAQLEQFIRRAHAALEVG